MSVAFNILERISLVAPLGLRFWDQVTGSAISDGLQVTAYAPDRPNHRTRAIVNGSAVYVLRDLPRLREFEHGTGDVAFWAKWPPTHPLIIEVIDQSRRFQPFHFHVDVPIRNLLAWEGEPYGSPMTAVSAVPLFSTINRPVLSGMAEVRAELWDPTLAQGKGGPAAWALLEAEVTANSPSRIRGFADYRGRVALMFPYPEPLESPIGASMASPLASTSMPLSHQQWPIRLHAAYQPSVTSPPVPDLRAVLNQPPATLWANLSHTQPLGDVTLKYGQELVVRSQDASGNTRPAVLLITAA